MQTQASARARRDVLELVAVTSARSSGGSVLNERGYNPIDVHGLSSTRYEEIVETISQIQRQDVARRVDIIIMQDSGQKPGMVTFDSLP